MSNSASYRRPHRLRSIARWVAALAALACSLPIWAGPSRAGGFSNLDFGIRRMGMFAVTAIPDDGTAVFHNPAGLTLLEGTQFYHSQSWFVIDMGFRMYDSEGVLRPDHEIRPTINIGAIPFLGLSTDFGVKGLAVGFAVYAPNTYGAALPEDEPTRYHVTSALFIASRATLAAAYDVTQHLSLGLSVSLINVYLTASQYMNLKMMATEDWDMRFESPAATRDSDFKFTVEGMEWTAGFDLGLILRPIPTLRFGVAFSSGSPVELEGDVTVKDWDPAQKKWTTYSTGRHKTTMVIPMTLRAGFNWEFIDGFQIGADIYWWRYSALQEQRTRLSGDVVTKLGMNQMVQAKNNTDSWNWNVGLFYSPIPELDLMMGYQEDYTSTPDKMVTLDNPSRDQRGIGVGLRWRIRDDLRIGLAYVHNWFESTDIQNNINAPPSNMKAHGASHAAGLDILWRLN